MTPMRWCPRRIRRVVALQAIKLIQKHKVTPPGVTSFSWDNVSATFNSGLTAMAMNYHA
jgi:hypothetical protein